MPDISWETISDIVYRQCACKPVGVPSAILTHGRIESGSPGGVPRRLRLTQVCMDCGRMREKEIVPKREEEFEEV